MTEAKKCKINALYLEEVVYVPHQQSISALIALSHVRKRGAKYWTRIISILSVTFFSNFRPENLKKNCPKDTLKMLHLCKCHETNVVDLWPREGWVCPVNLTDRERMVKLLNAASLDSWGSPFLWSNFLFFPQKNSLPSFPAELKKID